jgi:hypothetical protein
MMMMKLLLLLLSCLLVGLLLLFVVAVASSYSSECVTRMQEFFQEMLKCDIALPDDFDVSFFCNVFSGVYPSTWWWWWRETTGGLLSCIFIFFLFSFSVSLLS